MPVVYGAQMPTPPTLLLLGVTTSGRSRTSLAQEPTHPLSSLSLVHELAWQTILTCKAHEPAHQPRFIKAACHATERGLQRLAYTMSGVPGLADASSWAMEAINAVALEIQCWYQ